MEQGTVKTVTDKGLGFIIKEGSEKDIFYHENSLVEDIVTYDVKGTPKGLNATDINY
ncbi:MAG TPA: cold shock domain-containing protein [Candidatus Dojkabacteria bacterium]|nr:cold shock domain-containing protein [Candidatus Dojkabacteria bacterium]